MESTHRLVFPAIVQIPQSQRSLIERGKELIAEIVLAAMIWKGSTHHGGI